MTPTVSARRNPDPPGPMGTGGPRQRGSGSGQAGSRSIRALKLARPDAGPVSLPAQLRTTAAGAWRWLARNVRVALATTRDIQGSLHPDPAALRAMIRKTRIALVTTRDRAGMLHSEPMEASDREFDGELWFATRGSAPVLDRIRARAAIQVTYVDSTSNRCVVLDGIARVCGAADQDDARTFIRVDIMSADVWE